MRSLATLLLAYVLSVLIAGVVQNQFAVAFKATEEFIVVVLIFVVMSVVSIVAFAIALLAGRAAKGIDWTAAGLVAVLMLGIAGLVAFGASGGGPLVVTRQDLQIIAEIVVPTILMIVIQWWMVRRRWMKANRSVRMDVSQAPSPPS